MANPKTERKDGASSHCGHGHHQGRHHRHHHHHRHGRGRSHSRRWVPVAIVLAAAVATVSAFFLYRTTQKNSVYEVTSSAGGNVGSGYRDIVYEGQEYHYNDGITTILWAGLDSEGEFEEHEAYFSAPRADSIFLIVLDERSGGMHLIALNRDTMTDIRRFTLEGVDRGLFEDHLGYAYAYGNGGQSSCDNLTEAVSSLLYGIPVNEYFFMNRSSMPALASVVGPVTVTVPNDDLAEENPEFTKGRSVVIDENNVALFVRSRDTSEALSNVGRMERQKAYFEAVLDKMLEETQRDAKGLWDKFEEVSGSFQTSITRSQYLDLAGKLNRASYGEDSYWTPEGEQVAGKYHDEFYPDQKKLLKKVIDIFYLLKYNVQG